VLVIRPVGFFPALKYWLLLALVLLGLRLFSWQDLTQNHAETRPDHPNPALRTGHYPHSAEALFFALQNLINNLPRWQIVEADLPAGKIRAERTSRLFRFTDDIEIEIKQTGPGHARLDVRSASRVGKGDFGQNARNIQFLLEALAHRLSEGD